MFSRLLALVVVGLVAGPLPTLQGGGGQSSASALTTARRALTAGQPAVALRTVEPLLARTPGDHDVVQIALQATIALNDSPRAYAIYDTFVQATSKPAADLLKIIAIKELRSVAAAAEHDPRLQSEAYERLARDGNPEGARGLRAQGGTSSRVSLLADSTLAKLGDESASLRITSAFQSADEAPKTAEAEAVARSGQAQLAPLLVPLLKHPDPYTRIAAAEGLAALGYMDAVDAMRTLLGDGFVE